MFKCAHGFNSGIAPGIGEVGRRSKDARLVLETRFRQRGLSVCMRDLQNPRWMYVKAALFIVIGLTASGLIIGANPTVQTSILLILTIWSFCRAYYFAFYVIERYVDGSFKFSGLTSVLAHLWSRSR
jgi:hypothetical protein